MTTKIFKTKPNYETQGEWLDRIALNCGKALCLIMTILAVVGAVAHLAATMWGNLALDLVVIVLTSVALGKEVEE